jgi:cob(I)alamin adenosyltransferase
MKSQVTTKRGDAGITTALSGDPLPKSHPVMECVGNLDELRACTARVIVHMAEAAPEDYATVAATLNWIQHIYFLMGSACSDPLGKHIEYRRRNLMPLDVQRLEDDQQRLEERTPLPHAFILRATNVLSAEADVACTVARRFERSLVRLKEHCPDFDAVEMLRFVNRLSDFLYILARFLEHDNHLPVDYAVVDFAQ